MNKISEIETMENVDLTGENQHGFKNNRSTSTTGMAIQSTLARALEQGKFALMV